MRVVSQDGYCDIPYNMCAFSLGQTPSTFVICVRSTLFDDNSFHFATYSTEEKALKAMEMLREKYTYFCTAETSKYWFAFNNPKVFRFPQDDEIEV